MVAFTICGLILCATWQLALGASCPNPRFTEITAKNVDMSRFSGSKWYLVGSFPTAAVDNSEVYYHTKDGEFRCIQSGREPKMNKCTTFFYVDGKVDGGNFTFNDVDDPSFTGRAIATGKMVDTDYDHYLVEYACYGYLCDGYCFHYGASLYVRDPNRKLKDSAKDAVKAAFESVCLDFEKLPKPINTGTEGISLRAIIGVATGAFLLLLIVVLLITFLYLHKRRRSSTPKEITGIANDEYLRNVSVSRRLSDVPIGF